MAIATLADSHALNNANVLVHQPTAAEQALNVPELIQLIVQNLWKDKPTLAACVRVNNVWATEVVRVLWTQCGEGFRLLGMLDAKCLTFWKLAKVEDLERRQWYANHIKELYPGPRTMYSTPLSLDNLLSTYLVWEKPGSALYDQHLGASGFLIFGNLG